MRQGPLEDAMDDQVRIAANGRGEMGVLIKGQREMPQWFVSVARLLERTQHQVRQDSLFRLARDLLSKPLVVLRPNLKILRAWKLDDHRPLARANAAPDSPWRRNPPVTDGDLFFGEPRN